MESKRVGECPLRGASARPDYLVGRRLEEVVASWHLYGSETPSGPLDVWLVDSETVATHLTTGSDWCLILEISDPFAGVDCMFLFHEAACFAHAAADLAARQAA